MNESANLPDASVTSLPRCPDCGAELQPGESDCWLCRLPPPAQPGVRPEGKALPSARAFGLESVFLVTTLAALLMGVWKFSPDLSVALGFCAYFALIRAAVVIRREHEAGWTASVGRKLRAFAASFGVVIFCLCAPGIVVGFVGAVCDITIGVIENYAWHAAQVLGTIASFVLAAAGLIAVCYLYWYLWPRASQRQPTSIWRFHYRARHRDQAKADSTSDKCPIDR